MSNRKTLKDSTNAISLPGLDYGAPPSDSPECQTTNHAGPPVAPVLPSPAPAKSSDVLSAEEILSLTRSRLESLLAPLAATNGTRTTGIYGLSFTGSSKSESLQKFMESRYRARTDVSGSPEYQLAWKRWIMVLGRPIFALRGSLRRTSDSGSTGWRTPTASDGVRGVHPNPNQRAGEFALSTEVHKSGWPTPKDCNSTGPSETETRQGAEDLQTTAQKTGWPSPCAPSGGRSTSMEKMDATGKMADGTKHTASLEHAVKFSGWPTCRAEDSEQTGAHRGVADTLSSATKLAGWSSPRSSDPKAGHNYTANMDGKSLAMDATLAGAVSGYDTPNARDWRQSARSNQGLVPQTQEAFGETASGTPAKTGKSGGYLLNPAFSLWLMLGAPLAKYWLEAARRSISTRSPKQKKAALASSKAQETPSFQL